MKFFGKEILVWQFSFRRWVRLFLFVLAGVVMFSLSCADRMIFYPPAAGYVDGGGVIKIDVTDNEKIAAMYFENADAYYTILFSHGNAEDIGNNVEFFEMLKGHGFSVLAYDYRGYGHSDGRPSEKNSYKDIEAAYGYLTGDLNVSPERVIVYGRSVGAGPSVYLATQEKFAGLILESPFTSAFRVVTGRKILPFDKFDNLGRIERIDCALLIMGGEADNVVPVKHGKKLYDKANEPKMSLWVEGAGHNDFMWVAGQQYWRALEEFEKLAREHGEK
jgi:fermentation-respiration switch protein FrsA (DUF1100 family)